MRQLALRLAVLGSAICTLGAAGSDVVNVGKASGYSISFVKATPEPGSKLTEGENVSFTVVVKYDLQVADKGRIVLVFQDQDKRPLFPGTAPVSVEVTRGTGTTTLTQDFQVPLGVRRIELFVPLMPAGYSRTQGELLMKYSVRRAK